MVDPLFISQEVRNKIIQDCFLVNSDKTRKMFDCLKALSCATKIINSETATEAGKAEAREARKTAYLILIDNIDDYSLSMLSSVITRIDVVKDQYTHCKTRDEFNKNYVSKTIDMLRRRSKGEQVERVVNKQTGEISIKEIINKVKDIKS